MLLRALLQAFQLQLSFPLSVAPLFSPLSRPLSAPPAFLLSLVSLLFSPAPFLLFPFSASLLFLLPSPLRLPAFPFSPFPLPLASPRLHRRCTRSCRRRFPCRLLRHKF